MTSKERVLTAFARNAPDRVPVNYMANAGIDRRLKEHFGLPWDDSEGLRQALGVDFRGVGVPYRGPKLHEDIPVMIHSCGSSSWAYEDFVDMGITVVDTLQPEAKDMAPAYLKRQFGGRLAFHGCISTAGPVATGTVKETVDYCRRTLGVMMPGGGYCFAPTHLLQDNSPTDNVVAMYATAREYGRY